MKTVQLIHAKLGWTSQKGNFGFKRNRDVCINRKLTRAARAIGLASGLPASRHVLFPRGQSTLIFEVKRFTETTKWRDPWYRKLSPPTKLLWNYLTDNCDCVGLIDPDFEAISFDIGATINETNVAELGDRAQRLPNGKIFIPKFIPFQYGIISESCPAHKPVIKLINQHHLTPDGIGYQYPILTLPLGIQIPTGEEKNKKGKGLLKGESEGKTYSPESRVALHWLNEKSGRHYRESETSLSVIQARLNESGVDIEGVKKMIERQCLRWKGTTQEEYLRPETLFGKQKFDNYYAAKDLPIHSANGNPTKPDHAKGF